VRLRQTNGTTHYRSCVRMAKPLFLCKPLEFELFSRLEDHGLGSGVRAHAVGPGGRIHRDRRPSVVVARHDTPGVEHLDCLNRIVASHGKDIADGQHGDVEPAETVELHIEEQGGIARKVEAIFTKLKKKSGRDTTIRSVG